MRARTVCATSSAASTSPSRSSQAFTFTPSYNGGTTFNLQNGQSNDSGALVPGNYSVSESVPAGWQQDSATCDDGSAESSRAHASGSPFSRAPSTNNARYRRDGRIPGNGTLPTLVQWEGEHPADALPPSGCELVRFERL